MKKSFTLQVKNLFSICIIALTLLFALKSETAFAQPAFTGGAAQFITICQDSGPNDITSLLAISDVNVGSTETWSIVSSTGGSLTGFTYATASTGATVTPVGLNYTPPAGSSGTRVFQIMVTDGTVSDITTVTVTIDPSPATPLAITGTTTECVGATNTLSDAVGGGTWSTDAAGIASIDAATGDLTGVSVGTANITYTISNSCGSNSVFAAVTIITTPSVPAISGASSVCVGATTTLSDATTGGTWTTDAAGVASIDGSTGDVTGVSVGTANITYSVTNGCGTGTNSTSISVIDLPTVAAISGASSVCVGSTITLTDATAGGSWTTDAASIASVNATGDVTGVGTGLATISYSVSNSCGTTVQTAAVTVNDVPTVAAIGGTTTICVGATATLTDATAGGTWSTDAAGVASIDATTGDLTGVATGTANITYSVTNTCGTTNVTSVITVSDVPTVAAISGVTPVCVGATITLADATTGGTWSTDAAGVASVEASTGIVTGVSGGTANISYSVTNGCGTTTVTAMVTVNPLPATPSSITGTTTECVGATTTLTDAVAGGTWSTDAAGVASIDAATGDLTGVSVGTANITYTISNSCGSNSVFAAVTIITTPSVPAISGASSVCVGATTTLTDATTGGTWTTDAAGVASIDVSSGDVTGVSVGTANITYSVTNACGTGTNSTSISVIDLPTVAAISGASSVCVGLTITLTDATAGGSWTTDAASIASVNATGDVTGVGTGLATISYSVSNSCGTTVQTAAVTVNDVPVVAAIGGTTTICVGATATLTDATASGTWSTDAAGVASIDVTTGDLTGVAVGTANITYSVTNTCGTTNVTSAITVNDVPTVATISGAASVCVGATITLTDATTGGTWSSVTPATATVNTTGDVTGVSSGGTTIQYTVTNGCGSNTANHVITVNPLPATPLSITGTTTECVGATTTLADAVGGGTWSTDAASVASIDAATGDLTGVSVGTANITYTISNSCGSNSVFAAVTIITTPSVPAISGASSVCVGATTTLTDATTGGTWTTDAAGVASVDVSSGDVTGVSVGTANITYSVTNGCGTGTNSTSISVIDLPTVAAISGASSVCVGSTITLTDATAGGSWTTDAASIASVNATGDVTGVGTGLATISYSVSNSCGTTVQTAAVTVNDVPSVAAIGGTTTICVGATATLTDATAGGTWSTDAAGVASIDATTGDLTGVAVGTANITYSVTNTCGTTNVTSAITVNDVPTVATISGSSSVCETATITLTDATTGGTWTTDAAGIASVEASTGIVTGVTAGTANISYTVTNACGSSSDGVAITVNPAPNAGSIAGSSSVCVGANTTLTDAAAGGTWSSDAAGVASIDAGTGVVTGVSTGSATISYSVTNGCGTAVVAQGITVIDVPVVPAISGASSVCETATITLTNATTGGTWSSDASGVATVDASTGVVTGVASGTANITYSVTNACGTGTNATSITVNPAPATPAAITGTTTLCVGFTTTLANTVSGGSWSTDAAGIASVDASTGDMTGVSAGTANITYSITNSCGTNAVSTSVSIIDIPFVAAITGASSLCVAATTTLTDATSGGTWSTDAAGVASIDAGSGVVNGVSAGTANITYSVTNSCGTGSSSTAITVDPAPATPVAISGTSPICVGSSATFTDAVAGGSWSTDAAGVASVDASTGNVSGISAGTANISYTISNGCGSNTVSISVNINDVPAVPAITGSSTVCVGATTTLADALAGGSWSTDAAGVASVDAGTGVVTGVSTGTANITYSVTNACGTTDVSTAMTVNDVPVVATTAGPSAVCETATITLTNATTGGSWSSAAAGIASVDAATGIVTGISAGSTNITYTVTNTCGSTTDVASVTVNPAPHAGTLSGASAVCAGSATTLSSTVSGGSWSSDAVGIASVDAATGAVSGISQGTATISYSFTNGCGTDVASVSFTVNDIPVVGSVTGPVALCPATTITLSNTTTGGTWSSSATGVATVDPATGIVTGVTAGSATITYNVTNSCGSVDSLLAITVDAAPAAGTISGLNTICTGTATTLTSTVSGGVWSSDNASVATINTTGDVFGASAGTATISYSFTNGCGTDVATFGVTVNGSPVVSPITGLDTVCAGNTVTLADATTGGTWSLTDLTVATVDASGNVTGFFQGIDTIQYTVTASCGSTTVILPFYVNDLPAAPSISGATTFCAGATNTFTSTTAGGTWSSTDATVATIDPASGVAMGTTGGVAIISYSVTNACGTGDNGVVISVTSLPVVGAVTGVTSFCNGTSTTYSNSTSGGTWATSDASIATIDPATGFATGLATGSVTISYSVTGTCGTVDSTLAITVDALPTAGSISGPSTICLSAGATLTDAVSGGTWATSDASVASIDPSTGVVTVASIGSATIFYTVTNGCGSDVATYAITTDDVPAVAGITGTSTICLAGSFTFTDATTGGLWSTSDASIASINAGTGDATGVAIGTATLSYSVTNTCGTTDVTFALTVDPAASAGAILGSPSTCAGTTVTLTDGVAGGIWSTSDATIASVDAATGDVTGIAAGTATISYAVTNSCATAYATLTFTVDDIPVVAAISGTSFMCVGTTSIMTDATASGVWESSDPTIATIDPASGDVTGLSTGTVFISYTVTNGCGPNSALTAIFIDDLPVATPITGASSVCAGSTTTLADAMAGGTWATSDASFASVNAGTGDVNGVSIGSATISYSVTNGCGTTDNTTIINVITVPSTPAAITGTPVVCVGSTTLLSDATPGGTWSSSSIPQATVDASGLVTGLSAATLTISYTLTNTCGSTSVTVPFTVNDVPPVAPITGATFVCFGGSTPLSDATGGGTWSSSDATIASIDPASGVATGVAGGSVTITYAVTNSCGTTSVTYAFDVTPLPVVSAVTGTSTVCAGGTFLVHNDTTGGVWSSSDNTVATIDAAGIVTGVAAGSATMTYTLTTVCGTTFATLDITVTDVPVITPVVGVATVCVGFSTIYTDPTAGGVWSSSDASIASVDASGNVTGVGLGSATISYTVTNFCGSTYDSLVVTVAPAPVVGTITGATSVCVGSTTTLADAAGSGTWSSTDLTIASIDPATGDLTGVGAGTVTISYTVSNSCGSDAATYTFTVNDVPSVPGITGITTVCEASTTSLGNAIAGGTWSTSSATVASVDIAGVVYGVLAGTATISYSVTNVCGTTDVTTTVTVNPLPTTSTITGTSSVCVGSTVTLSDATAGGTWTSSDATIASIDGTTGDVTGVSEGAVTITYTITNSCGSIDSFFAFTANDVPIVASITGVATLCPGATGTLADATTGGTWTSSDITIASIDASTGLAYGVAGGTVSISYAVTNICGVTTIATALTVIPLPAVSAISGGTVICAAATTTLSDTASGGTWSSSATGIASVNPATGVVTGISGGTAIITYDVTNACGTATDTIVFTVNGTPTVGAISGTASFCVGTTSSLADTTAGGTWSSSDTSIATIDASGVVTGVAGGAVNISYAVANSCGTTYVTYAVTVNPLPVIAAITGTSTVCVGSTTTLADATASGVWTTSDATVASINTTGVVTGVATGAATITYTVTSTFGCTAYVITSVTVNPLPVLSPIGGPTGVALGDSITVTDTAAGGTWTTSDASIASVNSSTGRVYGITHGTVTITYTKTNAFGCSASVTTTIGVAGSLTHSFIFPGGNATLCHGNPIPLLVYTADTSNHLTYQWYRNSIAIAGATDSTYIATTTGYFACAITNAAGTAMLTGINIVPPPNPIINITGGNILFTGSFVTYQWMLNGVIIPGATSSVHTETASGFYNVIVSDANGCTDTSASFVDTNYGLSFVALPDPATTVRIYPNPATSVINIETAAGVHVNVSILSMDGKVVIRQERATAVDVSDLASAMYMIMIYDQQGVLLKADRFVKNE